LAVSFAALSAMVGTAWMLCVSEAAIVGPPAPPTQLVVQRRNTPLPETLTVKEVLELTKPLKLMSLGCGYGDWDGKTYSCWWNHYTDVTVPWLEEPAEVEAGFTGAGLVSFQVNDVRYECNPGDEILKRLTD
jgi:hypothetical protein